MNTTATFPSPKREPRAADDFNESKPLSVCENCRTSFGEPVEVKDDRRTFKCPRCGNSYTQFLGF